MAKYTAVGGSGGGGGFGAVADTATVYVSQAGHDDNDGRSPLSAFRTPQAAIDALPINGGIVELGYGDFPGFGIDATAGLDFGIKVRGRGMGKSRSYTSNATPVGLHPTRIVNTSAGTDAVTVLGGGVTSEDFWPTGVLLEDLAVVGTTATRDGISLSGAAKIDMRRVCAESHGRYGIYSVNGWIIDLDMVRCIRNGTAAANESGGARFDYISNHINVRGTSEFSGNHGYGFIGNGRVHNFFGALFERNLANAAQPGSGIYMGTAPGQYNFHGCWFESNGTVRHVSSWSGVHAQFLGCRFEGNGATAHALRVTGSSRYILDGNSFSSHTAADLHMDGGAIWGRGNHSTSITFGTIGGVTVPGSGAGATFDNATAS